MKILLDTHVLLWWLGDDKALSKKGRSLISDEKNIIFVSAATAWEIVIKQELGNLIAPDNLEETITDNNFKVLEMTLHHTMAMRELPHFHHDPFDRMLIAQAKCESLTLLSADDKFKLYDCEMIKI